MGQEKDITKEFVRILKEKIPGIDQELSKVRVVAQDSFVVVRVLGKNTLNALEQKSDEINRVVSTIVPDPKVMFSLVEESSPNAKMFKRKREMYTFSNFIVSNTNKFAFTAVKEVSEEPTGQPIEVYGPPSVGKTHLLKALHYKVKRGGKYSIILLNMGKIVQDIFFHVNNRTLTKYMNNLFAYNYVLIDDLQKAGELTSGKGLTMVDSFLFDIYEAFFEENGKQLVLTCDRSPMALPFSDRVRSRLFSGYAYEIDPPDEKLKRIYLEKIMLQYDPLSLPDVIKSAIVKYSKNFRQIEELTKRAVDRYSVTGDKEYVINQISVAAKTMGKRKLRLTPDDVIDAVCKLTGVNKKEIMTSSRLRNERYKKVTGIIIYILIRKLHFSHKTVAQILGKQSRTITYKLLRYVDALRIDDMDFLIEMDDILETLLGKEK